MDINEMTREDFGALPGRVWDEDIGEFDALIILPVKREEELHDSGYRLLDFVAIRDGKPICRLSGRSDIIHLDGIGGFGKDWQKYGKIPKTISPSGWRMDCLPASGLLRLSAREKLTVGLSLSSFEIFL